MSEYNRQQQILKLIVEHHIKTAEPVGSQTLIEKYGLPYSSATIRNEMAELENLGYLEKTHTSSGRVPSALGYRYYVDYLRDSNEIEEEAKQKIQALFSIQDLQIDNVIKHGCEIISEMTHLTSIMLGPNAKVERLQRIQLVPLNENSFIALFVTDCGHVENKAFNIPQGVNVNDLESCIKIINDRISGTTLDKVIEKVNAIKPIIEEKVKHYDIIYKALYDVFMNYSRDHVSVFGRANMLEQPEFTSDFNKLKEIVKLFEDAEAWDSGNIDDDISVLIGDENDLPSLDDISVVSAKINIGDTNSSKIAIVGPQRMDYTKAIRLLEYFKKALDAYYKKRGGN